MVMNSIGFCLSRMCSFCFWRVVLLDIVFSNVFLFLEGSLLDMVFSDVSFSLSTLNTSSHCLLAFSVPAEKYPYWVCFLLNEPRFCFQDYLSLMFHGLILGGGDTKYLMHLTDSYKHVFCVRLYFKSIPQTHSFSPHNNALRWVLLLSLHER